MRVSIYMEPHAYPLRRNCHCERSVAISLGQGTLLRERDRRVAALLAMTKWARAMTNGHSWEHGGALRAAGRASEAPLTLRAIRGHRLTRTRYRETGEFARTHRMDKIGSVRCAVAVPGPGGKQRRPRRRKGGNHPGALGPLPKADRFPSFNLYHPVHPVHPCELFLLCEVGTREG